MSRRVVLVLGFVAALAVPVGRTARACSYCSSSGGVVGCAYRYFYGAECVAWWDSSTGGFQCVESGECGEYGPPAPGDPKEPWNPTLPSGIWTGLPGPVEAPDGVFARLPDISRRAIAPLS